MSGKLYVIGTPIGNLGDITLRQLEVLENEVDFIAAEDTRVTLKLLNHFEIKKQLVSFHEHNTSRTLDSVIARIEGGENCGIVTDAGMPCISDPGEPLVKACHERGIRVESVPGPSAVVTALAISGQSTQRFTFEGFLSAKTSERRAALESLKYETRTMIFYEAPHKLLKTLCDMRDIFGEERSISLCHELTKIHESVDIFTLGRACEHYEKEPPKGEYVLVLSGAADTREAMTEEDALNYVKKLISEGMKTSKACKEAAAVSGIAKSVLYERIVRE